MKPTRKYSRNLRSLTSLLALLAIAPIAGADTITKSNDPSAPLNAPEAWVGGIVPDSDDIALFDSTLTADGAWSPGGDLSWYGIQVTNPGGVPTIAGVGTINLGA